MISTEQRFRLFGLTSAALLAPPIVYGADEEPLSTSDAAADAVQVVTSHGFNSLIYIPFGLIFAALLLEIFAQKKKLREIEPAILFMLCSAAVAAMVSALLAYTLSPIGREGGQLSSYFTWMILVAAAITAAFFFKRKARNQKLFSLKPAGMVGRVVVPKTGGQKGLIVGYRIALLLGLLLAFAGIGELPLTETPTKTVSASIRALGNSKPTKARAAAPAPAPTPNPSNPNPEAIKSTPGLASLIGSDQTPKTPDTLSSTVASSIENQKASTAAAPSVVNPPPATAPPSPAVMAANTGSTPPPETVAPPPTSPPMPTPATPADATPAPPAPAVPAVAPAVAASGPKLDKNFFATKIKPIIDSKCISCHGTKGKPKGDLRLDTVEFIKKGSTHPVIVPGAPENSDFYTRLVAADEEDLMPPKDKGGKLPDAQINAVKAWIAAGADFGDGSTVAAATTTGARAGGKIEEEKSAKLPPPDAALLSRLTAGGVIVRPLSSNGALLDLDFSHAEMTPNLADLGVIAKNVYGLDLNKTKIRDEGMAPIAQFSNLSKLLLNRTGISDAGLAHLKGLTELETLNLYATGVTDAGLENLTAMKKLQKLFLFNTKCTPAGADKLKAQIPGIVINLGE